MTFIEGFCIVYTESQYCFKFLLKFVDKLSLFASRLEVIPTFGTVLQKVIMALRKTI